MPKSRKAFNVGATVEEYRRLIKQRWYATSPKVKEAIAALRKVRWNTARIARHVATFAAICAGRALLFGNFRVGADLVIEGVFGLLFVEIVHAAKEGEGERPEEGPTGSP